MTDEQDERAARVWREALEAGQQDWPKPIDDRAAAAVIAADRAGLVAEVERLAQAWEAQHKEKVKERDEARLWFERAQKLAEENARLREALERIGIYGCGMLSQPAALNAPREVWLDQRIFEMERTARAALGASHE